MRLPAVAALVLFFAPLGVSAQDIALQDTAYQEPAPAHVSYLEGAVLL